MVAVLPELLGEAEKTGWDLITGTKRIRDVERGRVEIHRGEKKGREAANLQSRLKQPSLIQTRPGFDWPIRPSFPSCSSCSVPSWQDKNHLKNIRKLPLTREHL